MTSLKPAIRERLHRGVVIPAHPLALDAEGNLDAARQAALTRYYLDAGAGGVAVGVHTTQFEIRQHGLYEDVLRIAIDTIRERERPEPPIAVAGVIGPTESALKEAALAATSVRTRPRRLAGWPMVRAARRPVAGREVMPVFGFYLQPRVGGGRALRLLARVAEIETSMRSRSRVQPYRARRRAAVAESSRRDESPLHRQRRQHHRRSAHHLAVRDRRRIVEKRIVAGLSGTGRLTKAAVEQLERCHARSRARWRALLTVDARAQVTDCNAAFFDSANAFAGQSPACMRCCGGRTAGGIGA